jgi:hypothetical protein
LGGATWLQDITEEIPVKRGVRKLETAEDDLSGMFVFAQPNGYRIGCDPAGLWLGISVDARGDARESNRLGQLFGG